jgi:hypothetical protein
MERADRNPLGKRPGLAERPLPNALACLAILEARLNYLKSQISALWLDSYVALWSD